MRNVPIAASGDNLRHLLLWTERALFAAGVGLLAWVAWVLADAWMSQRLARETLALVPPPPAAVAAPSIRSRPRVIVQGAPIGELSIPRVRMSAVVLQGSDARTLRRGPGHIENTSFPGQPGNVAIAGHRDSFFRGVRYLRTGDDIFIDTPEGRFQYRVSSLRVVPPSDTSVLRATEPATLTLITCYPFWVAGPAPDRFVVLATEVARPAALPDHGTLLTTGDSRPAHAELATTLGPPPRPSPARRADTGVPVARVDDTSPSALVHQAIDRFQLTYNARLAVRHDGERLSLGACQVTLGERDARAVCDESAAAADPSRHWVFALTRTGATWSIWEVETP